MDAAAIRRITAAQFAGDPKPTGAIVHYGAGSTRTGVVTKCNVELPFGSDCLARPGWHSDVTCEKCREELRR
jgi:hypothetical protein